MMALLRTLFALFLPIAVLAVAFLVALNPGYVPPVVTPLMPVLPYFFATTGAILAWRFKRSRNVFLLVIITAFYWLLTGWFPVIAPPFAEPNLGYHFCTVLLPINILILGFSEDRGVFTGWGILQIAFLLAQGVFLFVLVTGGRGILSPAEGAALQAKADYLLVYRFIPPRFDGWSYIPQPALLISAIVVMVLTGFSFAKREPVYSGLLAVTVCSMAGMHYVKGFEVGVFFTAATVAVSLSLFQESYSMAFVDELTDLPSRRALTADFKKLGRKYVIAMADVDHFKKFNDTYGHDVGDDVLRMVAGKLAKVSGGGTAYRYGGEEFTIVFPKGTKEDARNPLNALRADIEATEFRIRGPLPKKAKGKNTAKVTISIGVAERCDGATTPDQVIKLADNALYKAKRAGRNCVTLADEPAPKKEKKQGKEKA